MKPSWQVKNPPIQSIRSWLSNSRFYILTTSIIASIAVASGLRLIISSDQLFYIRLEQIYGLLAIGYWVVALLISPVGSIIGPDKIKWWEFARRAIGVGAAYFALLHTLVAVFGQLGGWLGLTHLPIFFRWSLISGGIGLIILLIMTALSLDQLARLMKPIYWRWLGQLNWLAALLVLLHLWSVGTHLAIDWIRAVAFIFLAIIGGLEIWRRLKLSTSQFPELQGERNFLWLYVPLWLVWLGLLLLIPTLIPNLPSIHHYVDEVSHG